LALAHTFVEINLCHVALGISRGVLQYSLHIPGSRQYIPLSQAPVYLRGSCLAAPPNSAEELLEMLSHVHCTSVPDSSIGKHPPLIGF
jgi:hypothetical protein